MIIIATMSVHCRIFLSPFRFLTLNFIHFNDTYLIWGGFFLLFNCIFSPSVSQLLENLIHHWTDANSTPPHSTNSFMYAENTKQKHSTFFCLLC